MELDEISLHKNVKFFSVCCSGIACNLVNAHFITPHAKPVEQGELDTWRMKCGKCVDVNAWLHGSIMSTLYENTVKRVVTSQNKILNKMTADVPKSFK